MGLLDSTIKSLPSVSGLGSVTNNLISYATAPVDSLVNESFSAVTTTFGSTGPFTKLGTGAPTFQALSAAAVFNAAVSDSQLSDNPYYSTAASLVQAQTSSTSAAATNAALGKANDAGNQQHKVQLTGVNSQDGGVVFDNMPEVTENRTADYEALQTSQLPGEFQKYRGTKSTTWTISATFTCRTREEAQKNYYFINRIRSWCMPFFGQKQLDGEFSTRLGGPPPVLNFSGWRGLVGTVPVVLTNAQWNWPRDCDWIPTNVFDKDGQEIPFPTVMNINLNIVESFSAEQFNGFDLTAFRFGLMLDAYAPLIRAEGSKYASEPVGGNQGITNSTPQPAPPPSISEASRNYGNEGRNNLKKIMPKPSFISEIRYDEQGNVISRD